MFPPPPPNAAATKKPPYAFQPGTGGIWKVSRMPVGGVDAGAGGTAGIESLNLIILGTVMAMAGAAAGAVVIRRRRCQEG